MIPADFILFATVYALAVALPGPGIVTLVARVLARGRAGIWAFIAGFVAGDLIWLTLAATGLAYIAQTFATLFLVVKYLGIAYLLHLAWKFWRAPIAHASAALPTAERPRRQFTAALTLTLGNPKAIVFFLAILPATVDLTRLTFTAAVELGVLIALILNLVLWTYVFAASSARHLFRSVQAMRILNRISGGAIAAVALAMATR